MAANHVHKYLWRDHSQPLLQQWQITLTDNEALAFLAFVTSLIAYTQTRAWRLICRITNKLTRPIQLPDDDNAASLNRLTQQEALLGLINRLRARFTGRQSVGNEFPRNEMRSVSIWFGIMGMVNVATFITLGVIVPWLLTAGLEVPVVQSRMWDGCGSGNRWSADESEAYLAADRYRNCWYVSANLSEPCHVVSRLGNNAHYRLTNGICLNNSVTVPEPCAGQDGIIVTRPKMDVTRNVSCPFAEAACQKEVKPLRLEHVNMSLLDLGINLMSSWRVSHRLTCAPLELSRFIYNDPRGKTWLRFDHDWDDISDTGLQKPLSSLDSSSLWMDIEGIHQPMLDLNVLQLRRDGRGAEFVLGYGYFSYGLHPDFRDPGGDAFIVLFNAGKSQYSFPMEDPMYSAHREGYMTGYVADYEYTAMGCVEQYQVCIQGAQGICSNYTDLLHAKWYIDEKAKGLSNTESNLNVDPFDRVLKESSVSRYLEKKGVSTLFAITQSGKLIDQIDPWGQWIRDVQGWFEASVLFYRANLKGLVFGERSMRSYVDYRELSRGWTIRISEYLPKFHEKICGGHVLLRDGNYTNINFLGLLITLAFMVLISATSHAIEIQKLFLYFRAKLTRCLKRIRGKLYKYYLICGQIIQLVREAWRRRQPDLEFGQGTTSSNVELDFPVSETTV